MKLLKENKLLFLVIGLVVLLRIPNLFEPYWYGDEGVYLTLGQAVRRGLVLYRDIHDNKPPLLYWLAALAENLFWFKFTLMAFSLGAIGVFTKLAQILFRGEKKLVTIATIIFAFFSTLPLIEGNIANAENFLVFFTVFGFLILFLDEDLKPSRCFVAGGAFAMATLFKVPTASDFVTAALLLLVFKRKDHHYKIILKNFGYLLAGFLIPILGVCGYYFVRGSFWPFLVASFLQNFGYLGSWQTGSHQTSGLPLPLLSRALVWLSILVFVWRLKQKFSLTFTFLVLWFASSLFGATLSGRPYGHYLLTVVPPLSLVIAYLFGQISTLEKKFSFGLFGLLIITLVFFKFWFYPVFSYYGNFIDYVIAKKTQAEYFAWFGPKVNRNYQIADFIITHSNNQDKIFVWGDEPFIYALSKRLPAGRYTVAYHVVDFKGQKATAQAILKEKPKMIIKMKNTNQFLELGDILKNDYSPFKTIDDATIYLERPLEMI